MFSKIKAKILPAKDFDVVKGKDGIVCYKPERDMPRSSLKILLMSCLNKLKLS